MEIVYYMEIGWKYFGNSMQICSSYGNSMEIGWKQDGSWKCYGNSMEKAWK